MKEKNKQEAKQSATTLLFPVTGALLLVAVIIAGYFFYKYQTIQNELKNPSLKAQQEVSTIVDKVAKLIELPTNETPTIATVSDTSKLKGQVFFAKSENGDKVLIYQKAKKAILYRPSINKLIEVSTINLAGQDKGQVAGVEAQKQATSTPTIATTPTPVRIAIYNGTTTVGVSKIAEKQINDQKIPGVKVISTDNATRNDYTDTLIIDLQGTRQSLAEQLATIVNGRLAKDLPAGEKKPDADVLIIIGK